MVAPRRNAYVAYRYVRFLLHEFRWPLGVFLTLVLGGGLVLKVLYRTTPLGYAKACHAVFMMVFGEQTLAFPAEWYLQPLFFLIPVVGLAAIADSVVRLGYLIVTSKRKLQEWQIMRVSLMKDHVVVVGLGKVGYRVVRELLAIGEDVVGVDRSIEIPLVAELQDLGVQIIHGDARLRRTLEQAGVERARAVILATDNDLVNLDAALTARQIRSDVHVVVRLFDDTLVTQVAPTFNMLAISTSMTSAPAFVAAATGREIRQSFRFDGEALHVTDLTVASGGALVSRSVPEVEATFGVTIARHRPAAGQAPGSVRGVLRPDDRLLLIAAPERIGALTVANRPKA